MTSRSIELKKLSESWIVFKYHLDNEIDYGDAIVTPEPWHLIEGPGLEH